MSADFGANDWLVEEMYERYQADPTSVEPSWIEFFKTYNPAAGTAAPATITAKSDAPKAGTPPIPKATSQVLTPAPSTLAAPVTSAPVSTPASVDDQINPMTIQLQTLSLKNAPFREIPYVYPLILHFKFICCHK